MRLIDGKALEKVFEKMTKIGVYEFDWPTVKNTIRDQEEIEAIPTIHAHWERRTDVLFSYFPYKCSHCGDTNITDSNYCPNCGCVMDEEKK